MAVVGVLALQGGYSLHVDVLRKLGHATVEVRTASHFTNLQGLVLPGGESSVHLKLLERNGLMQPLKEFLSSGKPVLATCAGLILCARKIENPEQFGFACLDIGVERNAWGSQADSFECASDKGAPLVFIRAPRIRDVGADVKVLDTLNGEPVLVRQGNITGATYHPEMTEFSAVHDEVFRTLH